jgi:hypothetical protein
MTLIIASVAISAIILVNSRFHRSLLIGLLVIVLPFLLPSFSLPYLLPVRCPKCRGKMRFQFLKKSGGSQQTYAYTCDQCDHRHEWEGGSSGSTLDNQDFRPRSVICAGAHV